MIDHRRPILGLLLILMTVFLLIPSGSSAREFVGLKIYPEHVGVFVTTGRQQFLAFGVTESGEKVNITDKVKWQSSDTKLVTIDANGLAKVLPRVTSGQVKITCAYLPEKLEVPTSLTIVHIQGRTFNGKPTPVDVTTWPGGWPSVPLLYDQVELGGFPDGNMKNQLWYEIYLYDVTIGTHIQRWKTIPYKIPWEGFSSAAGLNSMIANIFSYDGGNNFWLHSWDYLASDTHVKGSPGGIWDDCWVGMMLHSFCEFTEADCNGKYRSNVYFTAVNNDVNCWGRKIMIE